MKRFLILFIAASSLFIIFALSDLYFSIPNSQPESSFTVARGERVDTIVSHLKEENFIRSAWLFKLALRRSGLATQLQPGVYHFSNPQTYEEMIRTMTKGGVGADEFSLRIIEGWDLRDINNALIALGYKESKNFYTFSGIPAADGRKIKNSKSEDFSVKFSLLKDKPAFVSLEGYLFPDTYRIYRDSSADDMIKIFLSNFEKKISPEIRKKIIVSKRSFFEVITMASIIEKEVRGEEDRRLVADIFWRRLEKGMPLQADSTVNYAVGKNRLSSTAEDLAVDSLYNTYKYPGLPLGPICNPGLSAIIAAIEPKPNANWYFLTDKIGTVHYAKTFEEHNGNKRKYLR